MHPIPNVQEPTWRQRLPAQILSYLPLTLFFQVGLMYAGLLTFLLAWCCSGEWSEKFARIKSSILLWPVVALSVISIVIGLIHPHPNGEFATAWLHYQTYWFLFPMLSVGSGNWQASAVRYFFIGAVIAASLFYLNSFGVLPDIKLFKSYVLYEGNKSILLGLLLAIAAGWMLHEWRVHQNFKLLRFLSFAYVVIALVLCTKSRTASLLFVLLSGLLVFRNFSFRWWQLLAIGGLFLVAIFFISRVAQMPAPVTCLAKEMQDVYRMRGVQVLINRGICTVHQVRDFGQTQQVSEDGMRLELYLNTWQMVSESPWLGHGIGNWLPMYQQKALGKISEKMTTPHNDYLLYWFELGLGGLLALLGIWLMQLRIARQMMHGEHRQRAMLLSMLSIGMMFAACFNAILRDGVFAFAMLILLAIPLAGVGKDIR
ncbi:O-antigen ligase family protein [Undibacterium fentianense]|uniref:O-antigen ligase family protein n=1 Tax=Undibacterium fentianense TaxID=2828728 RepID=A0A941DY26_9BURK|nr:O-antigen ligase family protein [Undibacterium fentianense]MBR7799554.1 O-antigen ligase family protein [Undibacterium fentianense]